MGITTEHRIGVPGGVRGNRRNFSFDLVIDHVPGHMLDTQEQAHGIYLQHVLKIRFLHVVHMGVSPHAYRVDKDVQRSELRVHKADQILYLLLF